MPVNRQIVRQRRARYGPYAVAEALGQGVRLAYNNRQLIKDATNTVKRKVSSFMKPSKKKYSKGGQTADVIGGGNDWTVTKRRFGRKKPRNLATLSKMVEVGMLKSIYRFQGLTNFDTNVGFFSLPNAQTVSNKVMIPFHLYDLTSFPNTGSPPVMYRFEWASTAASADLMRANESGQTPTGTLTTGWNTENGKDTSFRDARIMRHDWTSVGLNLYCPRKRTTRYDVMFVRIKDEFANLAIGSLSNASMKELAAYLERPCIFSNLQQYQTNVSKKFKIVKKFTYWVSAGQTTDVDTTVGKIKEARIFIRHDRIYNLDWRHEGVGTSTVSHAQADGAHYVQDEIHHDYPHHGSRLFMIIRAFAPERVTGISDNTSAFVADANRDPTYDILIRNSISTPY